VSFRLQITAAGLCCARSPARFYVHGHLPTPGPVIAHKILETVLVGIGNRGSGRAACAGCATSRSDALGAFCGGCAAVGRRLPSVGGVDLIAVRIGRAR